MYEMAWVWMLHVCKEGNDPREVCAVAILLLYHSVPFPKEPVKVRHRESSFNYTSHLSLIHMHAND